MENILIHFNRIMINWTLILSVSKGLILISIIPPISIIGSILSTLLVRGRK